MGQQYLPSKRAMLTYLQCMTAVLLLGTVIGMNIRRVHPVLVDAYRAIWVVMVVVAVLAGWRWLWRTFPWWASVLPMVSLACVAAGFGLLPLLFGAPTQTEQTILGVTDWMMKLSLFVIPIGGLGMLVAIGLNQVRR